MRPSSTSTLDLKSPQSFRVLLVTPTLDIGGAEQQLTTLAVALTRAGHHAEVAALRSQGPLLERLQSGGVAVHDLGQRGRWTLALVAARLARLVRRTEPQAVYSFLSVANIVTALARPGFRDVPVVWGVRSSQMDLRGYGVASRAVSRLETLLSPTVDGIIFNSDDARRTARAQRFRNDFLASVPNGTDTRRFAPDPPSRIRTRAAFGLHPDDKVVGLVARVDPAKDHATFLTAAAQVANRRPGTQFVCVGGGSAAQFDELRAHARALGIEPAVRFVPRWDDMPGAYNALDVLALSSRSEAFPNAIAEAMACGVPCVGTDVGDVARLVGDAGRVVPPGHPEALAAGILELLSSSAETLASLRARARQRVDENFSVDTLVDNTLSALRAAQRP